jgi:hypothetical protein
MEKPAILSFNVDLESGRDVSDGTVVESPGHISITPSTPVSTKDCEMSSSGDGKSGM